MNSFGVDDVVVAPNTVMVANGFDTSTITTDCNNDDTPTIQTATKQMTTVSVAAVDATSENIERPTKIAKLAHSVASATIADVFEKASTTTLSVPSPSCSSNPLFEKNLKDENMDANVFDGSIYAQEKHADSNVNSCHSRGISDGVDAVRTEVEDVVSSPSVDGKSMIVDSCYQQDMMTPMSKLVILKKELEEVIRMKNFSKAGSIQAVIECLENENSRNSDSKAVLRSELDEELNRAVEVKSFKKAAIVQARIEGLEKGAMSVFEVNALLRKDLGEELEGAIISKDFACAGTIQTRIERLERAH